MALTANAENALGIALANYGATVEITAALNGLSQTVTTATITTANITTLNTDAIDMSAAAGTVAIKSNTAAALGIGLAASTQLHSFDTRNTITGITANLLAAPAATIASAVAALTNTVVGTASRTITLTGTNTVTSLLGVNATFAQATVTDASVCTLTTLSSVHIATNAAAGGSLTITNTRMISTGVADCFLTNAGVWTDTACWEYGKDMAENVENAAYAMIEGVLDSITPQTWKYKREFDVVDPEGTITTLSVNDRDRARVGVTWDTLPDALRAPGEERGVSTGVLCSFLLGAVKMLHERLNYQNVVLESLVSK